MHQPPRVVNLLWRTWIFPSSLLIFHVFPAEWFSSDAASHSGGWVERWHWGQARRSDGSFDFLMSSQEGEPSLFVCLAQLENGSVGGKNKVIKQTIYQALCVCLSNLPYWRVRKIHVGRKTGRGSEGVDIVCCLLGVTVNDTRVWLPIHLTWAVLLKRKGLRNKLHSVI